MAKKIVADAMKVMFPPDRQMAVHPAEYLAKLKVVMNDTRGNIKAIMHMPYPADPLTEPEMNMVQQPSVRDALAGWIYRFYDMHCVGEALMLF